MESPPSLQELAQQSLLRNLPSPRPPLEDLPQHLFLQLFKEAFVGGHKETLQAMVEVWPFACLPLGPLMKQVGLFTYLTSRTVMEHAHLSTMDAVLEALEILLAQDHPRCKLQVLDLQDVRGDFWSMLSRARSAEAVREEQRQRHAPMRAPRQPLTILLDISIGKDGLNDFYAHFLRWVEERKAMIHVCCERLKIFSENICAIVMVLNFLSLNCIRELEVDSLWIRETMEMFLPYVSKMTRLHTLYFAKMNPVLHVSSRRNIWHSQKYASHLGKLNNLQELHINEAFFLYGQLHEIFRSLTPLKTLSLRSSPLSQSDVQYLAQAPSTRQLQHLDLRDIPMVDFSSELLRLLLEWVAGTLETLALERCEISDEQFRALMPALRCCSQLRTFSCCGNPISMGVLKSLLYRTARLQHLSQGLYPLPLQSQYHGDIFWWDGRYVELGQVGTDLMQILREIRPSHEVHFCAYCCGRCKWCLFCSLEPSGRWKVTKESRTRSCHRCFHHWNI